MEQLEQSLKEMRGELHKCCNGRPDNSLVSSVLSLSISWRNMTK